MWTRIPLRLNHGIAAWDNENTGTKGFSRILDAKAYSNVSIFGKVSGPTTIQVLVSDDGLNFFYSKLLTEQINLELPPINIDNFALEPSNFSANDTLPGRPPSNLAESQPIEDIWAGDVPPERWVKYDNEESIVAGSYGLTSLRRWPTHWQFQGSNDNDSWTTLDSQEDVSFVAGEEKIFSLKGNQDAYRYYRLLISQGVYSGEVELSTFRIMTVEVEDEESLDVYNFHLNNFISARYIRLISLENVNANIFMSAKA